MFEKTKKYLYEPKSNIGWVHGLLACMGALLLSYLSSMLIAFLIPTNYALKIVPNFIIMPILATIYGTWILFSKTRILAMKKILVLFFLLVCSLLISMKVF